jgi:predicted RecA/RadA family phage recombinase
LNHPAIGVAINQAAPGEACNVLISGFLTIPEWGLTAGNIYYLGDGVISATPANGAGEFVQRIGSAMSTDTLAVNCEQPVRL